MNIAKLFGVLVVGGSLLVADAGCSDENVDTERPDGSSSASTGDRDGGDSSAPDGAAVSFDAAGEEPVDCGFCPNDACCEYDDDGNGATKEGFVCCWASSC